MKFDVDITEQKTVNIQIDSILEKLEKELIYKLINSKLIQKYNYFHFDEVKKKVIASKEHYHGSDIDFDITKDIPESSKKLIFNWLIIKNLLKNES